MESKNIDHNTRLFISFDTPHRGANVPLGNQYWLKYFSNEPKAQESVEVLSTPAAKQMLVYHESSESLRPLSFFKFGILWTTVDAPNIDSQYLVTTPKPNAKFNDFFNKLYELGNYPDNLRKIAISNGRGDGEERFDKYQQLVVWNHDGYIADITGNTWSSSQGIKKLIFQGKIDILLDSITTNEARVYTSHAMPYDSSPGGHTNTSALIAEGSTMGRGNIINRVSSETFIPTISALDIHTHDLDYRNDGWYIFEDDLFHNIRADPNILQKTPFDAIYYPTNNQEHVTITEENKQWILCEIFSTKHDSYDKYCSGTGIAKDVRNSPDNISNDIAESRNPDISGYSRKVGIVWESCNELCSPTIKSDILYAESNNFGETWDDVINISNNEGNSINPQIVVSNSSTYVIWEDGDRGSSNIFFKSNIDEFCTPQYNDFVLVCGIVMPEVFTLPLIDLSNSTIVSTNSKMVADGDRVYVIWQDSLNIDATGDIFFRTSNDGGRTWNPPLTENPIMITDGSYNSEMPEMVLSETNSNNVYIVWQQRIDGQKEVFFTTSNDGGSSFIEPVNISNSPTQSTGHNIATLENKTLTVWTEQYSDIVYRYVNNTESSSWHPSISDDPNVIESNAYNIEYSSVPPNYISVIWTDDDVYLNSDHSSITRMINNQYDAITERPLIDYGIKTFENYGTFNTFNTNIRIHILADLYEHKGVISTVWIHGDGSIYYACGTSDENPSVSIINNGIVQSKNPSLKHVVSPYSKHEFSHIAWQGVDQYSENEFDIYYKKMDHCETQHIPPDIPPCSDLLFDIAECIIHLGGIENMFGDAIPERDCIRIDCTWNPEEIAELGQWFYMLEQINMGNMLFNQALKLDPDNLKIMTIWAESFVKNNDLQSAKKIYEKSIMIDPTHINSHNGLTFIYLSEAINAIMEKNLSFAEKNINLAEHHNTKSMNINPTDNSANMAISVINSLRDEYFISSLTLPNVLHGSD